MHKETIATVREVERHRLIHTISLRSLRVHNRDVHLLSHLIQRSKALTATIDALTRRKHKHRVDATRVVAATLDKVERQELHLCAVIIDDMASLGQDLSVGITQDKAERILLDFQFTIFIFIYDTIVVSQRIPSTLGDASIVIARILSYKFRREHRVIGIIHLRFDRRSEECDTQRTVIYLLNFDF